MERKTSTFADNFRLFFFFCSSSLDENSQNENGFHWKWHLRQGNTFQHIRLCTLHLLFSCYSLCFSSLLFRSDKKDNDKFNVTIFSLCRQWFVCMLSFINDPSIFRMYSFCLYTKKKTIRNILRNGEKSLTILNEMFDVTMWMWAFLFEWLFSQRYSLCFLVGRSKWAHILFSTTDWMR